jgi:acid phosphatase type 7
MIRFHHRFLQVIYGLGILALVGLLFALLPAVPTSAAINAITATRTPIHRQASPTPTLRKPSPSPTPSIGSGKNTVFIPLVSSNSLMITVIQGGADPVINAVGDIAACDPIYTDRSGYLQTAALLQSLDGPILGLGDYVYYEGTPANFTNCFDPVWGQFKSRFFPAAGNHEYIYPNASGYYNYFGAAAGNPANGYYSYNLGTWHVVVLNTNCSDAGSLNDCFAGMPQEQWLRADLAAHPNLCTLAYYHHPLYSSGKEGSFWRAHDLVQALIDNHVDLILNGHDHSYERFAPQDANGNADPVNGIPEIIAGTGGKDHSPLIQRLPNSLVFDNTTYGVLRVVLQPKGYTFQFVPVGGGTFSDSGSGACH